jgi:N-acetyl-alpha-D-glucosaminyl L-malate synthase BshA
MDERVKIGILCHPTYGGSGVVASELALTLAERGHDVHLFSSAVPPRLARSPGPVQVHVSQGIPYPLFEATPHDLAITSAVLTLHRNEGLDVLHAHYALPHAVSAYLARQAARADRGPRRPPKLVTTLHGTDITLVGNAPSYAPLTQFVITESDAVTAVSEDLARRTRENFCPDSFEPCAIDVIPNFVDTSLFHPDAARGKRGGDAGCYAANGFRAVHVSNFRPVKRVPWLVRAFAAACGGAEATLTLVGDGPDQDRCRDLARELGIAAQVRFLGQRDALPELLAPADVYLSSSSEESFGLGALEAMSCGTPVVSTRVGGVPEVIEHGRSGLLVDVDDLDGFAQAIRNLMSKPALLQEMAAAARRTAVERYDRSKVVQRYESLYERLLAEPAHAEPLRVERG